MTKNLWKFARRKSLWHRAFFSTQPSYVWKFSIKQNTLEFFQFKRQCLHGLSELILGLRSANERRRYNWSNAVSHWLGANLGSALVCALPTYHDIFQYQNLPWLMQVLSMNDFRNFPKFLNICTELVTIPRLFHFVWLLFWYIELQFSKHSRFKVGEVPIKQLILHWHHNQRDSVSNHRCLDCLLNRLFRRRSKKTSKLRVTGLCEGNSPVTPHKRPVTLKCFHLMTSSWKNAIYCKVLSPIYDDAMTLSTLLALYRQLDYFFNSSSD